MKPDPAHRARGLVKQEQDLDWAPVENLSQLEARFNKALTVYHGPQQYLTAMYDTPEKVADFAVQLTMHFPRQENVEYYQHGDLAMNSVTFIHLSDLGFQSECSSKMPPNKRTAEQLLDEIMTNGFVSEGSACGACGRC